MLGFTLPLLLVVGVESVVGVLMLCPKPVNQPAIQLARASHTQVGSTIFHTLAGVLVLLLASPLYDGIRLYYFTKDKPEQAALDLSEHEARTMVSAVLTGAALALLFFLRKLGRALSECERMSVSEAALLKQVKGLQSEYTRVLDSGGAGSGKEGAAGAPSGPAAAGALGSDEVAELRRLLADLERQNSRLQARAWEVEREHRAAESNMAALKTQAKGLENEYDRLLAENDELKRQLARAGVGGVDAEAAAGGFAKKDE